MKIELVLLLTQIIKQLGVENVTPIVERVADLSHGDYTTNVAMVLAKQLKRSPVEIAKEIVSKFAVGSSQFAAKQSDLSTDQSGQKQSSHAPEINVLQDIEMIEVAPPGFINFSLAASTLSRTLGEVLEAKEAYGTIQPSRPKADQPLVEVISSQPSADISMSSPRKRGSKIPGQAGNDKTWKKIMVEFAHPNTHKAFHIGHLRNITTGESIIRLLESQGHEVVRVNYQGDVGMHIAKCLYGILQDQKSKISAKGGSAFGRKNQNYNPTHPPLKLRGGAGGVIEEFKNKSINEKVEYLGKMYAAGSKAFEDPSADGKKAKEEIKDINYLIYAAVQRFNKERGIEPSSTDYMKFVHGRAVEVDQVYELWVSTRKWSLDYFDSIYARVGSHYDRFYFESECLSGVDDAKEAVKKGILKESDGAIIFDGKPYGLDTRVFVNSLGLPTYEAKELALAQKEFSEFGKLDKVVHVVGPEQASFFKVTFKVEELLDIQKDQQKHLIYGWVKLKHGKMSSRSGNVVLGEWLLDEAKKAILKIVKKGNNSPQPSHFNLRGGEVPSLRLREGQGELRGVSRNEADIQEIAEKAAVAAIKYSFLKVGTLQEIAFDIEESINFNGDSGPYLQYTYARCKSVLRKATLSVIPAAESDKDGVIARSEATKQSQAQETRLPHQSDDWFAMTNKLNIEEKNILRLVERFPEVVTIAATTYAPSALCKYLYDLAGAYNTFYNKHTILGFAEEVRSSQFAVDSSKENNTKYKGIDKRTSEFRLQLTAATAQVLKNGLYLLGIEALEQM
ncbi:MAG: hypothetical protein UV61_C0017G0003 [Candidatus Gottesmanbacteria bacterium GW2011_GWB1_43_11]|uniref:arginine--tRNA ligase n=1 Tax=Candidatus Gottesmanbacteria bacterium GW2011_GWB1_43_11 TaxID=1618446 RepID=A0A0G1CJ21_9BACT|nr:MAG: hypothetical protein UV61_C0017G0003 [Candidatus Gottesmanbacteria bacterium GW2011_GWB1_43_11]HCM38184.1 hypothetical protein [Patescibacteria group bacterium]